MAQSSDPVGTETRRPENVLSHTGQTAPEVSLAMLERPPSKHAGDGVANGSRPDAEAPGTPTRAEAEHIGHAETASTSEPTNRFEFNSQSIAGLVFFIALQRYRNRDTAMALALSLESALFWQYFAPPGCRKKRAAGRAAAAALSTQHRETKRRVGKAKGRPSRLQETTKGADLPSSVDAEPSNRSSSKQVSDSLAPVQQQQKRKRAELQPPTYSHALLQAGMAVLLRTERDEVDGWNKCWSLGKVLRINSARRTVDVVWLKPERGTKHGNNSIFAQRWVPWQWKMDQSITPMEWVSKGLSMASVQYGMRFPEDGLFSPEDQATLTAEVSRLEAAAQQGSKHALQTKAMRKNSSPLQRTYA